MEPLVVIGAVVLALTVLGLGFFLGWMVNSRHRRNRLESAQEEAISEASQAAARVAHTARLQNYEKRCRETKSLKPSYQAVKGRKPPKPQILDRPQGGKTGSVEELSQLLHEAWTPIFNSYPWEERPTWDAFYTKYAAHIRARRVHMESTRLSGRRLREKVRAWPSWKAKRSCWQH